MEQGRNITAKNLGPVIIVDDSADEALLVKRAVETLRTRNAVKVLAGGKELISHLEAGRKNFSEGACPAVILLDLHMSQMDGFEVMSWLRAQPEFRHIPVVAITGAEDPTFVKRAYEAGASTFLRKPMTPEDFLTVVRVFHLRVEFGLEKDFTAPAQHSRDPEGQPHR